MNFIHAMLKRGFFRYKGKEIFACMTKRVTEILPNKIIHIKMLKV